MSITVPENFRPSGGLVKPFLSAIPTQPSAAEPVKPRTWSFISAENGDLLKVTCPEWCTADHTRDAETPTHPEDIWCQADGGAPLFMPVSIDYDPEEVRVMSWTLNVRPFSGRLNVRRPHVSVELIQDAWLEDLDPEALEDVIDTLEARVRSLREAHAQLVAARAAYRKQAQA
ncbi:DUF6907 domain-containing protein [Streptomyces sp. NPDC015131]|uniref:DUF6907 domain-containing protein n=1 Tax=Streptomyces sp. NPDC015131 TaxID=3364941 RepID=UPI0036FA9587